MMNLSKILKQDQNKNNATDGHKRVWLLSNSKITFCRLFHERKEYLYTYSYCDGNDGSAIFVDLKISQRIFYYVPAEISKEKMTKK